MMRSLLIAVAGLVLIVLLAWRAVYIFNECRVIGHSKTYCILLIGR